ncbi:Methylase involved in ubiquinone/menaquinone biosynthesis [Marinactinospora thermotolerans DSM 45154]|uniref:Methylase involved in ubiquinone/menaquinone biosynthesis n=1 Tax=Marinactinospora thermotolerans DSM 45154 TaxID=1122192 RepID=A0A1T4T4K4_9ACTN|nr:class I SAM-dependent methyltransferase [Marinactinospora thermotolerans]SKA35393.1 Methylase involved in ubiquinone/menaquinone biosynthesis [Marinactinospora thermotolerans DSM 45154]
MTTPAWTPEPPAAEPAEVRRRHAANRVAWNEAAQRYSEGLPEAIAELRAGRSSVHPVERAALGDLAPWCRRAIHLQCASGRDTLSLLLEGAQEVVGVDISEVQVANARATAAAIGAPARFHHCDVLDTPHSLDGTADLVYTGRGALCWIHDLAAWAHVVARLLRPGGVVSVFDDHPAGWLFDQDAAEPVASGVDYFGHAESNVGWPTTYIGELDVPPSTKHERLWPIGDVVQALIDAGLTITRLEERPDEYWTVFPAMPEELRRRIPMTFLLHARRPA